MVREVTARYKSTDGREFEIKIAAERHEAFQEAERALESAQRAFQRCLANTALTADGQQFDISAWHRYWFVHTPIYGSPRLVPVEFGMMNWDVDEYEDVIRVHAESDGHRSTYPVNELYYDELAGKMALLKAKRERLREDAQDIAKLEAELGKTTAD